MAVIETLKRFLDVSEEEDNRPETEVIEDDLEAGNDDVLHEGRDETDDYVLQTDVDCVWRIKLEREPNRPRKIWEVGALDRSETRKSDGSATNNAGEDNTSRVNHEGQSGQSTRQPRELDDRVPSQLPFGYEKANVVVEDAYKQSLQIVCQPHDCAQRVHLKDTRRYYRF